MDGDSLPLISDRFWRISFEIAIFPQNFLVFTLYIAHYLFRNKRALKPLNILLCPLPLQSPPASSQLIRCRKARNELENVKIRLARNRNSTYSALRTPSNLGAYCSGSARRNSATGTGKRTSLAFGADCFASDFAFFKLVRKVRPISRLCDSFFLSFHFCRLCVWLICPAVLCVR